jgi:hypothetical protein
VARKWQRIAARAALGEISLDQQVAKKWQTLSEVMAGEEFAVGGGDGGGGADSLHGATTAVRLPESSPLVYRGQAVQQAATREQTQAGELSSILQRDVGSTDTSHAEERASRGGGGTRGSVANGSNDQSSDVLFLSVDPESNEAMDRESNEGSGHSSRHQHLPSPRPLVRVQPSESIDDPLPSTPLTVDSWAADLFFPATTGDDGVDDSDDEAVGQGVTGGDGGNVVGLSLSLPRQPISSTSRADSWESAEFHDALVTSSSVSDDDADRALRLLQSGPTGAEDADTLTAEIPSKRLPLLSTSTAAAIAPSETLLLPRTRAPPVHDRSHSGARAGTRKVSQPGEGGRVRKAPLQSSFV